MPAKLHRKLEDLDPYSDLAPKTLVIMGGSLIILAHNFPYLQSGNDPMFLMSLRLR
jgi:hypothetical protein